jgi:outer membrane receptor protein involved in Fe transport
MTGRRNKYPNEAMTNENYWYLNAGDVMTSANSGGANPRHSMFSYFARLSYNYAEKYMAEVVVRRDGSSNFGPNNRYATFPGVSLGWNVSNEKFWKIKNFDVFKLRFSWGQNGNERISPFSYTSIIGNNYNYTFGNAITVGSAPNNLVIPDVKWETSEQTNIGIDARFLNSRLTVTADYFHKNTKDLIVSGIKASTVVGNSFSPVNAGNITNKGFELELGWQDRIGDFAYGDQDA